MKNILIVEDNPANYYIMEFALTKKRSDYHVIHAEDIQSAHELFEQHAIDLILLDFNLPDGRGDDFLYWVRRDLNCETPVIFLTATLSRDLMNAMIELGANYYLTKPYDVDDVLNIIDYWVAEHVAD